MRIVVLRHVSFEGPGTIADWAAERGHSIRDVSAPSGWFPTPGTFDMLVVMGGPMGVYDIVEHPWLTEERRFIARAIDSGALVLGVCLGSQMVADAIGGSVHPGSTPEIGWFPVTLTPAGRASSLFADFPSTFVAGHWHGDTFDLPAAVTSAASSEVTPDQAFEACDGRVAGIQFHLEWTASDLATLVRESGSDLANPGQWVWPADALLDAGERFVHSRQLLFSLLDRLEARA